MLMRLLAMRCVLCFSFVTQRTNFVLPYYLRFQKRISNKFKQNIAPSVSFIANDNINLVPNATFLLSSSFKRGVRWTFYKRAGYEIVFFIEVSNSDMKVFQCCFVYLFNCLCHVGVETIRMRGHSFQLCHCIVKPSATVTSLWRGK